jgi:hypothetical protein
MNAKMLLPALIALQLTALALVVDRLVGEAQKSGRQDLVWQSVRWGTQSDCVARYASDETTHFASIVYRQRNGMVSDRRICMNRH